MYDTSRLDFKFRFVRGGEATGFGERKGSADEQGLTLNDWRVPFESIGLTVNRGKRFVFTVNAAGLDEKLVKNIQEGVLVIEVSKINANDLKQFTDRRLSTLRVTEKRRQLNNEGKADAVRFVPCPRCQSTIDLCEKPKTPHIYCPFCDGVFLLSGKDSVSGTLVPEVQGAQATQCEDCGFFGRVKEYTEFYFYFLLVVYGYRYKKRPLCDTCADRLFWKNFLINLLFVIGTPFAFGLKAKSMKGRSAQWKTLAKANALGKRGKTSEAMPLYESLFTQWPEHPGLIFNQAMARAAAGELPAATEACRRSLVSCANYEPAARLQQAIAQVSQGNPGATTVAVNPNLVTEHPLTTHL